MVDLTTDTAGIRSPNPFWVASGPPGNSLRQARLAFEAGWGGIVWKTVGAPVIDTAMRYGGLDIGGRRLVGLNNIELISDRPAEVNLAEIAQCKREFPDRAVVVSLMVESERAAWHEAVKRAQATGADGLELNFGCPHGMSERNMGSAIGQVPEYVEQITGWVTEVAELPVLVKLTPNITNVVASARAARRGGADGVSAINTINSIVGLDLDTWETRPSVDGRGTHGGYAGPAVKPIALHMVSSIATDEETAGVPISGIGGAQTWQDCAEFLLLGASTVQVCTGIMHHGFRLVAELETGLRNYLEARGLTNVRELVGGALPRLTSFGELDLSWQARASISAEACIGCGKCIEVCRDNQVDCIDWVDGTVNTGRVARVDQHECIGCDLCSLVCPVTDCITMEEWPRERPPVTWNQLAADGLAWDGFADAVADRVDSHGLRDRRAPD